MPNFPSSSYVSFFHPPLRFSSLAFGSHKNVFLVLMLLCTPEKNMIPTTPHRECVLARKHLYASYGMYCWPRFSNAISIFSPWTHTHTHVEWSQETPTTAILGSILQLKKTFQGNTAKIKDSKHIAGEKCSNIIQTMAE